LKVMYEILRLVCSKLEILLWYL